MENNNCIDIAFQKGSFKNFFTALYDDNEISEEDLNELREMLNKK